MPLASNPGSGDNQDGTNWYIDLCDAAGLSAVGCTTGNYAGSSQYTQGGRGGGASKILSGATKLWTEAGRPSADTDIYQMRGFATVVTHQELLDGHYVDDGTLYVKVSLGKAVS